MTQPHCINGLRAIFEAREREQQKNIHTKWRCGNCICHSNMEEYFNRTESSKKATKIYKLI